MTDIRIYSALDSIGYVDVFDLEFDDPAAVSFAPDAISGFSRGFFVQLSGQFIYDGTELSGGSLSGISASYNGAPLVSITDFDIDLHTLETDPARFEARLFGGPDTVVSDWATGDSYHTYGGDDFLRLGNGDDTVNAGTGRDTFQILAEFDPARITPMSSGFRVESVQGLDTLLNVEIVQFSDVSISVQVAKTIGVTLTGDANPGIPMDFLFGSEGDDILRGGTAKDWLFGDDGDDRLVGGLGGDHLSGGDGQDQLLGQQGSDVLLGGRGEDDLRGGGGKDRMFGQNGSDTLSGGGGKDVLVGGKGRDILMGEAGDDVLTGNAGRDIFVFQSGDGHDRITDFRIGTDQIRITAGASELADLTFQRQGDDVLVSFANVEILVEDVKVAALEDADNFLF